MDHHSTIRSENIDSIIPVYEEISRAPIQKYKTASSKNEIIHSLIFQVYLVVSAFIFGIIFGLIFSYWIKQSIILEMISNPTSFQIPNVTERIQDCKMLSMNKKVFEFDTVDAYLELGMVDNNIKFYSPPSRICFTISRTGNYTLHLLIKGNSSQRSQNVSVIFKNQTLKNPAIIINEILSFGEHKSPTSKNAKFLAKERDQVCLVSDFCLDEDNGNYISIEIL